MRECKCWGAAGSRKNNYLGLSSLYFLPLRLRASAFNFPANSPEG
jgi:hypothetical protein